MAKTLKMRYFGHVMRAHQCLGEIYNAGNNCRSKEKGKPRMRWMDDIKSVTGLSLNELNQLVKDRKKWRTLVHNIVKKRKLTNVASKQTSNPFENVA